MKRLIALALSGLLMLSGLPAYAAPVPYINTPFDTINAGLNTVITSVNTNLGMGPGIASTAIYLPPAPTSPVNALSITGAATGNPVLATVGGANSDTNAPLAIYGKGTGSLLLGGSSTSLAGLQVSSVALAVNDFVVTPGATGTIPTLISGGAGADANIGALYGTTGTGTAYVGGATTALAPLEAVSVASSVNSVLVTSAATGTAPSIGIGGASADANRNLNVKGNGTGIVTLGQAVCTGTFSANAVTCNGQRGSVTTASLSTAASTAAAAQVITNSSVTSSSIVLCTINGYAGTLHTNGNPVVTACLATSNTITVWIQNVDTTNALNNAVTVGFVVMN